MNPDNLIPVLYAVAFAVGVAAAVWSEVKKKKNKVVEEPESYSRFDTDLFLSFEQKALDCGHEAFDAELIAADAVRIVKEGNGRDTAFNQAKDAFDQKVMQEKYAIAE